MADNTSSWAMLRQLTQHKANRKYWWAVPSHNARAVMMSMSATMSPDDVERRNVLRGKLDALPPAPATTFRVYLASSATDMCVERAVLARSVYPELREYCRNRYNVELQVVDLRFGVEFVEDPTSLAIHLKEIKKCQEVSLGPTFVLLLGQKYGCSALPTAIAAYEFDEIRACAASPAQAALLDAWYSRDDNATPSEYALHQADAGSWGEAASKWRHTAAEIRSALQDGVRRCVQVGRLDASAEHKYFVSELENELEKGILEDLNANARCLMLQRHLEGVNLQHELAAHFVDLKQDAEKPEVDEHKEALLGVLTEQKIPSKINSTNIHRFTAEWTDVGGVHEDANADYLDALCRAFRESLRKQIDAAIAESRGAAAQPEDPLHAEALQHLNACAAQCVRIYGRDAVLQRMRQYIMDDSNQPLVLHGPPGIGKTCVIAKGASLVSQWLEDNPSPTVLLVRFLGTTPASSSLDGVVRSLCQQIVTMLDCADSQPPDTAEELSEYFRNLLQEVPPHLTMVILLDSIEALKGDPATPNLQWLPNRLPENVKLILSTVDTDHGKKVMKDLQKHRISKRQFVEIAPLDQEACKSILKSWLKAAQRQLSQPQWRAVEQAVQEGCSPLYLKLLWDHVTAWTSGHRDLTLPPDADGFYTGVMDALEERHGRHLAATVLGLLVLSRHGVSELELEDMLSIDDVVLSDVYRDYIPPVRRMPGILTRRLLHDLRHHTVQVVSEGRTLIQLAHALFERLIRRRHLVCWVSEVNSRAKNLLINYYVGAWADEEKPYTLSGQQQQILGVHSAEAKAFRYVPSQPTLVAHGGAHGRKWWHVNARKVRQLAAVLHADAIYWDNEEALFRFMRVVLFNWEMLMAMLMMKDWKLIMRSLAIRHVIDEENGEFEKRQIWIYIRSLVQVQAALMENPSSAMIYLLGQYIDSYNFLMHPSTMVRQADKREGRQFCALLCPNQQLPLAGDMEYLTPRYHTAPIRTCLFAGNVLFTISNRLVGVCFDSEGQALRTVVNAKIAIPEGHYFHLVVPIDEAVPNEVIDEDCTDGLLANSQLVLALYQQPKLFFVSASEGSVVRIVDCQKDLPAELASKAGVIAKMRVIPNVAHDHVVYVTTRESCPQLLRYSCSSGLFLGVITTQMAVLDIVQMADGQYATFLANGTVQSLEQVVKKASPEDNSNVSPSATSFCAIKRGDILTTWNQGKWGSCSSDVLVVGLESGSVTAFFGVNPDQSATTPLSANIRFPDQTPIHHLDSELKVFRMRLVLVLACTKNYLHLVKFEVGRDKQCSVMRSTSVRKRLQVAYLHDEVIVGQQMNAVYVAAIKSQADGLCLIVPLATLDVHSSPIVTMTSSNMLSAVGKDRLVAVVAEDGVCKAFSLTSVQDAHAQLTHFDRMEGPITSITAGVSLAVTMEKDNMYVSVWDMASGSLMKQCHHTHRIVAICLSKSERYLATLDARHEVHVWDMLSMASKRDATVPLMSHQLKGSRHWIFWSHVCAGFLVVCNSGQHVKVNPKSRQATETENPQVPKPLLEAVLNPGEEVLALGCEGTVLSTSEPCSQKDTARMDLKAKTGVSVSKYGTKVWRIGVWAQNTLLLIGGTLLCCKHTSNSIFPLQKDISAKAALLPAGPTLAVVDKGRMSVLTDINGNWVHFAYDIKDELAALTPDGKYAVCVDCQNTVKLVRIEDQQELASFKCMVGVSSLCVNADGSFVILGGVNGRMLPYVIADPDEEVHNERIEGLATRQLPVILQIERIHDPRYKVVQNMTARLETESFAGSEQDSEEDEEDDDDSDDDDDDDDSEYKSDDDDSDDDTDDGSDSADVDTGEHICEASDASKSNNNASINGDSQQTKRKKSAKKKPVFLPVTNGAVCLAPITYREPALQEGYKSRIQKISNRFMDAAITEACAEEEDAGSPPNDAATAVTNSNMAEMRKVLTTLPGRDPRIASSRLSNLHKRRSSNMSSPQQSADERVSSRACVLQ